MSLRKIMLHTSVVVATLLALLTLWQVSVAVAIFLVALALGACMYPLVEHLKERGWGRSVAIALAVCGSLTLVTGFVVTLAFPIANDIQELGHDATVVSEELAARYPDHWLVKTVREDTDDDAEEAATPAASLAPAVAQTMRSLVGTATELFQLGAHAAICVALSVYWTIDRQRIERLWLSLVPIRRRKATQKMATAVEREVGAYLRNELAHVLLATMLLWAGFEMLGMRYAALAALVAAFLQILPWLGNVMAVAAVMVLASGKWLDLANPWLPMSGWMAIGYLVVVLLFLEYVIEPRLFNRDRYNSFWTVLTTIALTFTFGIWGLLFGPAVGYTIQIILRQLHPLFFYEPARVKSIDSIAQQLSDLRLRYPVEDTPPEILSFFDRLEAIVESRVVASGNTEVPESLPT